MLDHPGTEISTLKDLAVALAREANFGHDGLAKCSLSGRKNTGTERLDKKSLSILKELCEQDGLTHQMSILSRYGHCVIRQFQNQAT